MTKRWLGIVAVAALAVLSERQLTAQQGKPWVHVHVTEHGEEPTTVQVNLPLAVVEVALEVAPEKVFEKGRMKLEETALSVEDMRRLWDQLRETGDAELVTVEGKDERVSISRKGNYLHIRVGDASSDQPKVRLDVPVSVVDALFEGEGPALNVRAAIGRLSMERGDIIKVNDGKTQVRIWIDERS